eukprot:10249-Pyramimonas_sp.AAC.1
MVRTSKQCSCTHDNYHYPWWLHSADVETVADIVHPDSDDNDDDWNDGSSNVAMEMMTDDGYDDEEYDEYCNVGDDDDKNRWSYTIHETSLMKSRSDDV